MKYVCYTYIIKVKMRVVSSNPLEFHSEVIGATPVARSIYII
jgi:hypothetical protein